MSYVPVEGKPGAVQYVRTPTLIISELYELLARVNDRINHLEALLGDDK